MSRIEEILAREQAATPGPWVTHRPSGEYVRNTETNFEVCMTRRSYDAEFIAHAREDVSWLLDKLNETEQCWEIRHENLRYDRDQWKSCCERLEAELAEYRDAVGMRKEQGTLSK